MRLGFRVDCLNMDGKWEVRWGLVDGYGYCDVLRDVRCEM